mmetsp:Transcript_25770/g.66337  ORF Transcript_25770/g.66337 Transcript_25770/m.66337 type:complete len:260 (-) Transcript_25770:1375-2154(-)
MKSIRAWRVCSSACSFFSRRPRAQSVASSDSSFCSVPPSEPASLLAPSSWPPSSCSSSWLSSSAPSASGASSSSSSSKSEPSLLLTGASSAAAGSSPDGPANMTLRGGAAAPWPLPRCGGGPLSAAPAAAAAPSWPCPKPAASLFCCKPGSVAPSAPIGRAAWLMLALRDFASSCEVSVRWKRATSPFSSTSKLALTTTCLLLVATASTLSSKGAPSAWNPFMIFRGPTLRPVVPLFMAPFFALSSCSSVSACLVGSCR